MIGKQYTVGYLLYLIGNDQKKIGSAPLLPQKSTVRIRNNILAIIHKNNL